MTRPSIPWIVLGILSISAVGWAEGPTRRSGRVQSFLPAERLLVIEETGVNGQTDILEVLIETAEVVRVWRDAAEPWRWRERSTLPHRLPAGTFVVIIGREAPPGIIRANRVEVPHVSGNNPPLRR